MHLLNLTQKRFDRCSKCTHNNFNESQMMYMNIRYFCDLLISFQIAIRESPLSVNLGVYHQISSP